MSLLKGLAKAAVGVVTLPATAAADLMTMGGVLTDKNEPYTVKRLNDIMENLERAIDPDED